MESQWTGCSISSQSGRRLVLLLYSFIPSHSQSTDVTPNTFPWLLVLRTRMKYKNLFKIQPTIRLQVIPHCLPKHGAPCFKLAFGIFEKLLSFPIFDVLVY